MKQLTLNIANTHLQIKTDNSRYYDFLSVFFSRVIVAESPQRPDVELEFVWSDKSPMKHLIEARERDHLNEIGISTARGDRSIFSIRKIERKQKVAFYARVHDNHFALKVQFKDKSFKDFWQYKVLRKPFDEWFFNLTYHLVYYPLFWYLEYARDTHILHASALMVNKKGIAICGMANIGKTSLSLKFLQEKDARFLSDNLVFFDKDSMYPCYELVRIHKQEDQSLWDRHFALVKDLAISKDLFQPKVDTFVQKGISLDVLIFPEFGDKFHVQEISSEEAANRAIMSSYLPAELSNYSEYRNLYCLMDSRALPQVKQYAVLRELLKKTRCMIVTMVKNDGLEKNFQKVKSIIEQ